MKIHNKVNIYPKDIIISNNSKSHIIIKHPSSSLLRENAVNKRYSFLRGTAVAIDLLQLGETWVHVIYALMKVVYNHLSQYTVYNSIRTQSHRVGSRPAIVRRGGPVHSDASGPQTNVLAIVRCCNHACYISFLGPIKSVCTRYCSILTQGAIIGSVLNRQGRTIAINTNVLLPPTHAFFLPGVNIEINSFLTISINEQV